MIRELNDYIVNCEKLITKRRESENIAYPGDVIRCRYGFSNICNGTDIYGGAGYIEGEVFVIDEFLDLSLGDNVYFPDDKKFMGCGIYHRALEVVS